MHHPSSHKQSLRASVGLLGCNLSSAPAKMQCQLRFALNFIPSRQHAANPLSSSMSQGPRAALSVPQACLAGGCPKVNGSPRRSLSTGTAGCLIGGPGRGTHLGGGRARRGSPGPRGRGWVRWPLARAVRGARLRARAAGSAVQSARACRLARRAARPGSQLPGGASRRAPPKPLPGALPGRGCRGSRSWRLFPRARAQPRGAAPPPAAFPHPK